MNPQAPIGTVYNPLVYTLPPDYLYQPTYDWRAGVEFDPFWLTFPRTPALTAALAVVQSVNVPNDADFEMRRIMYHFDLAAAALTVSTIFCPNVTLQIQDSGSGRNLFSAAVPIGSVGNPEGSNSAVDLPWPKIFTRNSTITITITNFDVAQTTGVMQVTLAGRKIFSKS